MKTKHMRTAIVFFGLLIVVCILAYAGMEYYIEATPDYRAIDTIKDNMVAPGEFYRADSTVCVESVDDLGYALGDIGIQLHYGKIVVNIPYRALDNAEFMTALSEIGITVYTKTIDGSTKYRITYWGEEVEEWSVIS